MAESTVLRSGSDPANPARLGLFGFGMTTVILNLHNTGFFKMNAMIMAMGLCFGGMAQVIAGVLEFRKNNTFGLAAFTSYGFFWLSLVALILLPKIDPLWKQSTGFEGIVCGMAAFYSGLAQVLNEVYGCTVLPLGTVRHS